MNGIESRFQDVFSHNWWMIALRGLIAIIFGVLAFAVPGITLLGLVFLFGFYAIANGILALIHAFSAPKGYPRFGALIFTGIISIAAGVLAFVWPGITALSLVLIIAFWAIANGIFEIALAVRLRRTIAHEWLLGLAGLLSLLLGVAILARPGLGALALLWWIAGFAIAFGILLIALGFRVRSEGHAPPFHAATP